MSTTKKVLKNSGIYGIVSILQKAIGFFLLPLYTSYLTTNDYGTVSVVTSIISFLSVFYMLSLNGAITRFYYDYKDDNNKIKEFWGTNVLFIIINCLILTSILILFHNILIAPIAKGIQFYPYIFLGLISITLNPIYSIFQSTLQTQQLGKKYGLNNLLYFVTNISLTVILVVIFKLKAIGVLLAYSITDIVFFIYTAINFLPKVKLKINVKYLRDSLRYSLPLLPHSLSGWVMSMIDRIFLNNMQTTAAVGVYNIGFQFGNILNVLTTAVNQAYSPWFFEKMSEGEAGKKKAIKFAEYAVIIYSLLALSISLFGSDILRFMVSKAFREGWKVIPFISFSFVFNGIYYFFVNPLFYNKKGTKYVPVGTFTSAILNTVLNIFLVPKFGMIGASVASLISSCISSILILCISNKLEKVEFNYIKIYLISIMFFILSMVSFINIEVSYLIMFFIKLLIILIIIFILIQVYSKEWLDLKKITRKRFMSKDI